MQQDTLSLSTKEAARVLRAHVETVRRLARRGVIPVYKVGREWRFRKRDLDRWIDSHDVRERPPVILVVDDEESFRETTRIFLERECRRVLTAANGEEALELVRREPVDLVLLDLVMPGMGGVAVLRELHRMDPELPVVVVTAYPDSELMAEALRYPPATLLPKPVEKKDLIRTVRRQLRGAPGRGARV